MNLFSYFGRQYVRVSSIVAWQNYRRKSTEGVSATMLYLWFSGNLFYGAYAVADKLYFGLIIQPQIFALFTLVNILQIFWYRYRWNAYKVAFVGVVLSAVYAGLHVGMWKAIEHAVEQDQKGAVKFMGVLPAILIALGFFPEFYVCIKEQSVEMSNFFIMLDISGGVFSTISLAFDHTFDYVASITYLIVVFLDLVLVAMKLYFYFRGTQGLVHKERLREQQQQQLESSDKDKQTTKMETKSKHLEEGY
ncbi:hypothetical protein LPJ53_000397 [Coemansia erecta]|uniref:PQ-loop-domain-containing protein n=1 Tax=Coemansia erecta TaxID=147472 RepID=A0A9W7Y6J7_9FUNG|nr:hypothetical protein LPJ53_000397 [Coemansia erecta]